MRLTRKLARLEDLLVDRLAEEMAARLPARNDAKPTGTAYAGQSVAPTFTLRSPPRTDWSMRDVA